jgi:hypothetical protein
MWFVGLKKDGCRIEKGLWMIGHRRSKRPAQGPGLADFGIRYLVFLVFVYGLVNYLGGIGVLFWVFSTICLATTANKSIVILWRLRLQQPYCQNPSNVMF